MTFRPSATPVRMIRVGKTSPLGDAYVELLTSRSFEPTTFPNDEA